MDPWGECGGMGVGGGRKTGPLARTGAIYTSHPPPGQSAFPRAGNGNGWTTRETTRRDPAGHAGIDSVLRHRQPFARNPARKAEAADDEALPGSPARTAPRSKRKSRSCKPPRAFSPARTSAFRGWATGKTPMRRDSGRHGRWPNGWPGEREKAGNRGKPSESGIAAKTDDSSNSAKPCGNIGLFHGQRRFRIPWDGRGFRRTLVNCKQNGPVEVMRSGGRRIGPQSGPRATAGGCR